MLLVNLWDLVSASVLWLLLGRQRALSPYSLFLSQLWVMSPHVTWSVRSSAKHSLWTAAARRKFTLGLIPAVSVYSFLVLGWWFFFTFPTSPWTIIWVCSSWYNPPKARKILFCFKSFFFFSVCFCSWMWKVRVEARCKGNKRSLVLQLLQDYWFQYSNYSTFCSSY